METPPKPKVLTGKDLLIHNLQSKIETQQEEINYLKDEGNIDERIKTLQEKIDGLQNSYQNALLRTREANKWLITHVIRSIIKQEQERGEL